MGHVQPKRRTKTKLVGQEITTTQPTREICIARQAPVVRVVRKHADRTRVLDPALSCVFDLLPRHNTVFLYVTSTALVRRCHQVAVLRVLSRALMGKLSSYLAHGQSINSPRFAINDNLHLAAAEV